jgi:hypothetical protein
MGKRFDFSAQRFHRGAVGQNRRGCHIIKFLGEKTALRTTDAMMRYRDVEIGACEESEAADRRRFASLRRVEKD